MVPSGPIIDEELIHDIGNIIGFLLPLDNLILVERGIYF